MLQVNYLLFLLSVSIGAITYQWLSRFCIKVCVPIRQPSPTLMDSLSPRAIPSLYTAVPRHIANESFTIRRLTTPISSIIHQTLYYSSSFQSMSMQQPILHVVTFQTFFSFVLDLSANDRRSSIPLQKMSFKFCISVFSYKNSKCRRALHGNWSREKMFVIAHLTQRSSTYLVVF